MPDPVVPAVTPVPVKKPRFDQNRDPLDLRPPSPMPVGQNYGADRFYLEQLRRMQERGLDISKVTPDVLGPKQIGYQPTFWEDPQRVARWHNAVQAAPKGWTAPDWLDTTKLSLAYRYFSIKNGDTPWTEWKYLNAADPGRGYLQSQMQVPPNDFLWPQDKGLAEANIRNTQRGLTPWSSLSQDQRQAILTDPNFDIAKWDNKVRSEILADPLFDWSRVPDWQKTYYNLSSNPKVMATPMGLAGWQAGKIFGPLGSIAGAVAGYGVGLIGGQEYDPTKTIGEQPTVAAGFMAILNRLSEFTEQGLGYASQVTTAKDVDAAMQMIGDASTRRAAWEAGRVQYEQSAYSRVFANTAVMLDAIPEAAEAYKLLAQGKVKEAQALAAEYMNKNPLAQPYQDFIIGKTEPVTKPGTTIDTTGSYSVIAMGEWREKIDAAIEAGATEEEIDSMTTQMLMEANQYVGGQMADLVIQSAADPMNFAGSAQQLGGTVILKRMAESVGMNTPNGKAFANMAIAFSETHGINDARRRYEVIMKAMPADEIRSMDGLMGYVMRYQAGLNTEGQMRAGPLTNEGLLSTPARTTGLRGFLDWTTKLTPESRARVGLGLALDNIRAIFSQFDNPADIVKFWDAVKNGDTQTAAAMAGSIVNSPEWATVLPAMRDFAKMPDLLAVWEAGGDKRAMMLRVAELMNLEPGKLLDKLKNPADVQRMFQVFKDKLLAMDTPQAKAMLDDINTGAFTPDSMKSIADIFVGDGKTQVMPWHPDQWKAMVSDSIGTHFGDWAVANLGLKPGSAFFRLAATMKSAQSLILLGFNPGYAVNNGINNVVTRAATGMYGFMTPGQIKSWMDRFGVDPYRMDAGVGVTGEGFDVQGGERTITDATRGQGVLGKVQRVLKSTNEKVGIFSRMSQGIEKLESRQAFAMSMKDMWGKLWRRGTGFGKMDPSLTNALKAIHPDAPDLIYSAIEAGMNRGEIESAIYNRQRAVSSREYIHNASTKLGMSPQQAGVMLDKLGVLDRLDTLLQKARTPEQIQNAFRNVDRYAQDQAEIVRAQELPARMVEVANRVEAEGPAAAMDEVAKLVNNNTETWLEHYVTFGEVFEKIDQIPQDALRNKMLRDARLLNQQRWTKANAWELTTYRGLMEALKWDQSPEIVSFMRSIEEVNRIKGDTYKAQLDAVDAWYQKWTGQWDNPGRWDEWTAMQADFDKQFRQMFRAEHDGMIAQGEAMGAAITARYGDAAGSAFTKGWADVVRFRDAMVAGVQKFREDSARMPYEQRQAAKAQFYQHTYPAMIVQFGDIRQMFGDDLQQAISGRPPKAPVEPGGVQTPETLAQVAEVELFTKTAEAEVARYDAEAFAEEQNIAKIASDHSFPTADENGVPLPNAKLDLIKLVRKYGGAEGARLRTWKDLAARPDIVERAFVNRDEYIRNAPELVIPPAVPVDAATQIVDAVETGVITPEEASAVVDALPPAEPSWTTGADRLHRSMVEGGATLKEYGQINKWLVEPIELELNNMLREAAEHSDVRPVTLVERIRKMGGINQKYMTDIIGEGPRREFHANPDKLVGKTAVKGVQPGLFTKNGVSLDQLVADLESEHYLPAGARDDAATNGGTTMLADLIKRATSGEKIYPIDTDLTSYQWVKDVGGVENAKRLIGQMLAGVEDPSTKRVRAIKSAAFDRMMGNIQNYPDARQALQIPFDENTHPIVNDIYRLETSLRDMTGLDIEAKIDEISGLYELLPEDAPDSLRDRLSAAMDKVFAYESKEKIINGSDKAVVDAQANSSRTMTRQLYEEQLRDVAGLPEDKIIETMAAMEALEKWYQRVTGEPGENVYRYYSGMDTEGKPGDLAQNAEDAMREQYNRFGPQKETLTPEALDNLAVAGIRRGEDFVRLLVDGEKTAAGRRALLDAVHKNDPIMAKKVASQMLDKLFQGAKGSVTFLPDKSAIMHFFEGKDITTVVHENGHVWRKIMQDIADRGNLEVRSDLDTLEKWAGVKDGLWDVAAEEKFARGMERYFADGIAPTPALARAFENFKRWMMEVYKSISGSPIDIEITPEVRDVFDRLMGKEPLDEVMPARAPEVAPAPTLHNVGDIVRLQDGTQATITTVRPDATLELDNGKVVSAAAVERVAAQTNMFGEAPPTQQTQLFQSADPRMPFGGYEETAGVLGRPEGQIMDEGWEQHVRPLLKAMEEEAIRRNQQKQLNFGGADDATQAALARYLNKVYQDQAGVKLQTVRWGESQRDFALLNYNRRYGFDKMADVAYPYQFWYTRSMINWAKRGLDRPGLMAFYSRLKMAQNRYENNLPERLRGKIGIPTPYLPDWMGGTLYIDPLKQLFPFSQMLRPFETMTKDKNQQVIDAERLLQEWSADGKITTAEAQQAAQTQTGATWDEAIASAKLNRESEISNPFDFMNVMLGPAWYLQTPYKLLTGRANEIQPTPITRTANAAEAVAEGTWAQPLGDVIGMFAKPEEWINQQLGIPKNGEFGDYYIDRQLANMVADGEISPQDANMAMMQRTGPAFDKASERVKLELAVRVPGASTVYAITHGAPVQQIAASVPVSMFGAGILPAGELKYRGLYDKWSAAWDKFDGGDKEAINNFFTEYPEYESYLARKKKPEERLRSFLIGQVWDRYMALDRADKRMVKPQLGDLFQQAFLDTNTRDYTALDIDTLALWSRYLGGLVPKVEETANVTGMSQTEMGAPTLMPPNLSVQLQSWEAERNSRFPGIQDIQSMYYSLPENQRGAFKVNFPQYNAYLNWRKEYIRSHPDLRPFIDTYYAQDILSGKVDASLETKELLKLYYSEDYRDPLYGAGDYLKDATSVLWEQLFDYQLLHQKPTEAAMTELRTIWEAADKPAGSVQKFLDEIIMPTLNQ